MQKFTVSICANIVRCSFEVEAESKEVAEEKGYELWGETKINEMTRVDVSDVDVF